MDISQIVYFDETEIKILLTNMFTGILSWQVYQKMYSEMNMLQISKNLFKAYKLGIIS